MGEGGVTALEGALGHAPTWINGGMDTFGPGGSVIAAMMAVATGMARHVLCFRTLWEATFGQLMKEGRMSPPGGAHGAAPAVDAGLGSSHLLLVLKTSAPSVTTVTPAELKLSLGDCASDARPVVTVKLTTVTTGPSVGSTIAILSGLSAGATVVTEGADGLEDGSKVKLPGDKGGPSTARSGCIGQTRRRGPSPAQRGER